MRHKPSYFSAAPWSFGAACLAGAALAALAGCSPKLGDDCKQGIDCDVRNQRICDRSQPGGYCTISNCKPGDCGDDGVCVRFRPDEPRLSVSYCMLQCDKSRDCSRDAYVCRSAEDVNTEAMDMGVMGEVAEVLDGNGDAKFCISKAD